MKQWQCKMCWAYNPDDRLWCGGCGHFYIAGAGGDDAHRLMLLEAEALEELLEREGKKMERELLKEKLLQKSFKELYEIWGNQYTSKEAIVEDIIDNDDGSVAELLEMEGSWLDMMAGKGKYKKREDDRKEQ